MITTHKTNYPVNRSPIYYGWIIWGVATLGLIATSPSQSFSLSIFIDHFIADFKLDRTMVSGLYGLATVIAALSLTWFGRKIDHYGNRRAGVVIGGMFALALIACSMIMGPITLFIAFMTITGLGQGALSLVSTTAIAQWFRRRRGLMMSLTLMVFALFRSVFTPWLNSLLETYGWQQVWIILGAIIGLIITPVIGLLMRNQPEDFGLYPDGDTLEAYEATNPISEESWTLGETLRCPTFWIFIGGRLVPPAWVTGLILHQMSLFRMLGHDDAVTLATYSQLVLISAGVSLVTGMVIDQVPPQRILTFQLTLFIVMMGIATIMTETWTLAVYAICHGTIMGIGGVFDGAVWANLFGREHQGAIRGFVSMVLTFSTAIGPILFGISFDYLGGYNPILWAGAGIAVIPLILSLFARKPIRKGLATGD